MLSSKRASRYREAGIFILRVGIGIMLVIHGFPKVFGGPEVWKQLGLAMQDIDFNTMPVFFGFLAAIIELFGGLFLVFGLFFRPALSLLSIYMLVLTGIHIGRGDPFSLMSHPLELFVVFVSLLFIGPGKYCLDKKLKERSQRRRL